MGIPVITSGDDVDEIIPLKKNGAAFNMTGATVTAAIVSKDSTEKYTADVVQNAGAPGADYANSTVNLQIPQSETAKITTFGYCLIEIQVDQSGVKLTWPVAALARQGQIA